MGALLRNPVTVYRETSRVERQRTYNPGAPGADPWYDQDLMAIFSPATVSLSIPVTDLVPGPAELGIDLGRSYMIGDKAEDILFGRNIGAVPVLVLTGSGREAQAKLVHSAKLSSVGQMVAGISTVDHSGASRVRHVVRGAPPDARTTATRLRASLFIHP